MNNSSLPLVLVTHKLPKDWLTPLENHCRLIIGPEDATIFSPKFMQYLHEAEGLISLLSINIDKELIEKCPNLKVISNMAVGYDNIDIETSTKRGIPVGNTPGVLTEATADLTMSLLLDAARNIRQASQDAIEGRWKTWSPAKWLGSDLNGATLGIIGFGKIGRAVAERAQAFGMKILYTDRCDPPTTFLSAKRVPLNNLLQECDFISLHVPLTPETHGMIDEQALKLMKPTTILINTSRGAVVDTQALTTALQEKWINAAALDVTDPEPLPPHHSLFCLNNCLITPHIGSATFNTRRSMAKLAVENLLAGLEGKKLPNCVNPEVYQSK